MDYPDVTLVIQVGLTERDQYIHRLGRTARAGKDGEGVMLCFDDEVKCIYHSAQHIYLTYLSQIHYFVITLYPIQ